MRVLRSGVVGLIAAAVLAGGPATAAPAQWDSIRGAIDTLGTPQDHWFLLRGRHIGYVVDGDAGEVLGTLTTSMFTPALRPHVDAGRVYGYGAYYSRTYYGERTDAVTFYDLETLEPVSEVVIPPKSAGIGHSGMIGLVDGRFLGVWNITPATSVSVVDVIEERFVEEISTPGCAGVYPVGRGFLMPCGDGALLHVMLGPDGTETRRTRSAEFFDVSEDPVYDYALPGPDGWVFVSFDGRVFEATVDGPEVAVSEGWSIFGTDAQMAEDEDGWRIGGRQPFAVSSTGLFATLMHEGGGQETFEDPGTAIWVYDLERRRKGFVIELEDDATASSIAFTDDDEPLLVVLASDDLVHIHDGATGRHLRTMEEMSVSLMQPLE